MSDAHPVLLVMDFQQGVVARLDDGGVVLAAAARAVTAARAAGIPVMFVRVAFRPGFPEAAAANPIFGGLHRSGDAMTEAHPETQVHPDLAPQPGEPVIVKRRVSAFSGSDLDVLLRAAGADTLVLAGISTSGVVLSTVRQAADLDYRITVLADGCADRDPEVHRVLVEKVFPRQALVTSVADWASQLAGPG